jgi:hypothetical protein
MARPEVTGKRFLKKRAVAARYACTVRTVDRWVLAGILPGPAFSINTIPYWSEDALNRRDRARTTESAGPSRADRLKKAQPIEARTT